MGKNKKQAKNKYKGAKNQPDKHANNQSNKQADTQGKNQPNNRGKNQGKKQSNTNASGDMAKNGASHGKAGKTEAKNGASHGKAGTTDGVTVSDDFISIQLGKLDLQLREVLGDGNCLFRALSDQLEGHSRRHLELREETVHYMITHQQDFEPFLPKDKPFTDYLCNLSESGTFAGHEAIVAFARKQQLKVVIHQVSKPLWEVNGTEERQCKELHIAYRHGNHYDSVRRIGDNSECPALLWTAAIMQKVTASHDEWRQAYEAAGEPFPDLSESAYRKPSPVRSEYAYRKPSLDDFEQIMSRKMRRQLRRQQENCQDNCQENYQDNYQENYQENFWSHKPYYQSLPKDPVATLLPLLTTLSI